MEEIRPRLFVSRCLGFERCRWNGETIRDETVERLAKFADLVHDCPEMGIGLGCPRDPVRVVRDAAAGAGSGRSASATAAAGGATAAAGNATAAAGSATAGLELYQPATGGRFGDAMRSWSARAIDALPELDGFILKSRSPSCGFKDVKVHDSYRPEAGARPGAGFFGAAVMERRPGIPVEDEGRLKNFMLRERFFGSVWTLARFREAARRGDMGSLVVFHSRHKLLLLLYSQKEMRAMGKIVANLDRRPMAEVWRAYGEALRRALAAQPKYGSLVNVVQHAFGGFSESLSAAEKALFDATVMQYLDERVPAMVLLRLVHSWAVRFGEKYLLDQVLFEPYPLALVDLSDSGKGAGSLRGA